MKLHQVRQWIGRSIGNRELLWTALGQGLLVVQSLIQTKVLTHYLTKADYGQWALILSIVLLVGALPFSALDQGVVNLAGGLQTQTERAALLAHTIFIYSFVFTGSVGLLIAICMILRPDALGLLAPVLIYAYSEILRNALMSFANSTRNRRVVALQRAWDLVSRCGLLLLAASQDRLDILTILLILTATNIVGVAASWTSAGRLHIPRWDALRKTLGSLLRFSWPLVIWALFGWLQNMVSRWYLDNSASKDVVASYAVVVSTSFFIPNFLYTVAASYILPILFARSGPLPIRRYMQLMLLFAAVLGAYSFATIPVAPFLLLALTDGKYVALAPFVPWLTASSSLQVVASLFTMELFRAGRTRELLIPSIAPGLISFALGFYLVPRLGLTGAVGTYIVGQLVYAVTAVLVSSRHLVKQERSSGRYASRGRD